MREQFASRVVPPRNDGWGFDGGFVLRQAQDDKCRKLCVIIISMRKLLVCLDKLLLND